MERMVVSSFVVLGVALAVTAPSIAQMSFRRLGTLPSAFPESAAYDISADGRVIVGASRASGNTLHAFRWTLETGMVDLGTFAGQPSTTRWIATSVNSDGSATAGWGGQQPFEYSLRWRNGLPPQSVGPGPGVAAHVEAHGMSHSGDTVVGFVEDRNNGDRAYRWTPGMGLQTIGTMSSNPTFSYSHAYGVSGDGLTIVGSSGDPSFDHAFRWREGTGFEDLGQWAGYSASRALAANTDGSVVAGFNRASDGTGYAGFRWTAATGMQPLLGGYPQDVSADGNVLVGGTTEPRSDGSALIWQNDSPMPTNLETLLLNAGVDLEGMSLRGLSGVSADGLTMTGWGYRLGRHEAFVVTIPEPTTVVLVLFGGLSFLRGRCR